MTESTETDQGLPAFPPARECPFEFPKLYAEARQRPGLTPVHMTWMDKDVSLVTRYTDVREVLGSEHASVDFTRPHFPVVVPNRAYTPQMDPPSLLHLDGAPHAELRRLIMPALTVKQVRVLEVRIREIVASALDELVAAGSPADLQSRFTYRVHGAVMTAVFGMDPEIGPELTELALRQLRSSFAGELDREATGQVVGHLVGHLERNPDAAPIVRSLHAARERGDIDMKRLVSLAVTVYVGGFETTASAIGAMAFELLRRPDAAAYLRRAEPGEAMVAVNELLRYTTVDHFGVGRVAAQDIELTDGTHIPAGERLVVSLVGANRDGNRFPDPDELDLQRTSNAHLTFGFGPYLCPGQQLARVEAVAVLQGLLRRLPDARLAVPPEDVVFNEADELRGPLELPVAW